MTWLRGGVFAAMVLAAGSAFAGEEVEYAPPSAWVKPAPLPASASAAEAGAAELLLQDDQSRYGKDGEEMFSERALKLHDAQALNLGNLALSWRPDVETLVIHKLHVIRDGRTIDLLAGGKKVTVIRRETNLEASMLDGRLTATLQPEDLRVGDVLDYAFTLRRHDPLLRGRASAVDGLTHAGVGGRVRIRALWDKDAPARWRVTEGLKSPVVARSAEGGELVIDEEKVQTPKPPAGAPDRFQRLGMMEFTTFRDWADVAAVMAPLYAKASTLAAGSPLKAEAARIRAAHASPRDRAFAALKLVQEQTRYVFIGLNLGGYLPADADATWTRRFGDCKAKTALLLALLRELGVEAQAAMVDTGGGDGLDERLPMAGLFDHVLVRARIDGQVYWLDGTRLGDRNLEDLPVPDYGWALAIQDKGAALERLLPKPLTAPLQEERIDFDATAGPDAPAKAHVEYLYRGETALFSHRLLDNIPKADLDRYLREYWKDDYSWIEASAVGQEYDQATGVLRLWLEGSGKMDWAPNNSARDFYITDSGVGYQASFAREPGPNRDAPYAVSHPTFLRRKVTIRLPNDGRGYSLVGGKDLDRSAAGMAYKRVSRLQGGLLTIETESRSLADEFPASEATAAEAALREISRFDVVLRTSARPEAAGPRQTAQTAEPKDASGYAARGAGYLASRDYDRAVADFTRAAELEPRQANHLYNRGAAYFQKGQDAEAMADFNRALTLNGDLTLALVARAELLMIQGKEPAARKDFERAIKSAPGDVDLRIRQADAYQDAGRYAEAIRQYDEAMKFGAGRRVEDVSAARCEAKAKQVADAGGAFADCDAALKAYPNSYRAREGRTMTLVRLGRFDEAIGEYDALIRRAPDWAPALYGRGVAKLRKGQKDAGDADLKAALAMDGTVADSFRRYGLAP